MNIEELVVKAKEGDKEAFGKLYEHFFKKIYRYCRFNSKTNEDAQDICQETFVRAWKSLNNFSTKKGGTFQSYLFQIARNLIIDASRKKKTVNIEMYENLESDENILENYQKKDDIDKVRFAIERLEQDEKNIIILRYFEELSTKEIAEIVDIKDGALRVKLHRIQEKIGVILDKYYERKNN